MASCDSAMWYSAPVIVGGSGGSGTRGVALLLDRLGVQMACSSVPTVADPALCNIGRDACNDAGDCSIANSFDPRLSWLRDNFSALDGHQGRSACDGVVDRDALSKSLNASRDDLCGGSQGTALRRLRMAVRPQYQQPLRWGFKNPHSTYYVNIWLKTLFPCAVYVNTVRDIAEMTRERKHFDHRVREAARFGMLSDEAADELFHDNKAAWRRGSDFTSSSSSSKTLESVRLHRSVNDFYVSYVHLVNVRLVEWSQLCLAADRVVHVPLQRMVALTPRSPACLEAVAHSLATTLRIDKSFAVNVTHRFAASSLRLVQESLVDGHRDMPSIVLSDHSRLPWPSSSPLQPSSCDGTLLLGRASK